MLTHVLWALPQACSRSIGLFCATQPDAAMAPSAPVKRRSRRPRSSSSRHRRSARIGATHLHTAHGLAGREEPALGDEVVSQQLHHALHRAGGVGYQKVCRGGVG